MIEQIRLRRTFPDGSVIELSVPAPKAWDAHDYLFTWANPGVDISAPDRVFDSIMRARAERAAAAERAAPRRRPMQGAAA